MNPRESSSDDRREPGPASGPLPGLKALVVDDEAFFCRLLARQLEAMGIASVTAASGEEAIEAFGRERPDMVLMDIVMPGMGGLEATRRLKALCGERWVPVILVSALAEDEAVAEGLAAGADDYINKPIRAIFFTAKIRSLTRTLQLRQSLEIAAGVFRHIRDGVVVTDASQRIIDVNPAFTQITGYSRQDLLGQTPRIYGAGLTPRSVFADMWRQIVEHGYWRGELINRRKNGVAHPELVSIVAVKEAGEVRHYVGIVSRINTHRDDFVTGLPGRRTLRRRLAEAIDEAARAGRRAALLVLDIDRFKEVNEAMGFEIGDMLLRETAQRLRDCVREGDQVFRTGSDEFAIVAPNVGDGDAFEDLAERIPEILAQPFHLGGEIVHASASVGVAFYPDDAADLENLLTNADHAMEKAKPLGGGRLEYFVAARQREAGERRRLIDDLRKALAEDRFTLQYQPIIELATGRTVKAEALIRWQHPERGLVTPDTFIAAAERTGLIKPIGQWAIGEAVSALRQMRRWRPGFQVSVNVSAVQLLDRDFEVEPFLDLLAQSGVPGSAVTLEFTEGLLLHATDAVLARLDALRDAGVQFALDDFGKGYSSLSYLHHFHVDILKIDQAFILGDPWDDRKRALCEAIVSMGHAMGLKVIAEGIETQEQRERMVRLHCDFGQGYLFGQPMSLGDLESFLRGPASGG